MSVKLYVEGGGDHNKALKTQCRRGFSEFLEKAGFKDRMPRIVASGGRRQAYDSFRTAHENANANEIVLLLVDSEAPLTTTGSWEHVRNRPGDGWLRPSDASDDQLHLMVQTMEAWFHADIEALQEYYGQSFRVNALSRQVNVEAIPKSDLVTGLQRATTNCQKGSYSKGDHSFQILARISPTKVRTGSPVHAERFLSTLERITPSG